MARITIRVSKDKNNLRINKIKGNTNFGVVLSKEKTVVDPRSKVKVHSPRIANEEAHRQFVNNILELID
nr:hypothetical protein [uncultured Draconibacterium sp.]